MTTTHHTKSIVAALAIGALAIAAPAGASVLEPVTAGWDPEGGEVSSVTAISHSSSTPSAPAAAGSVTALSHPTGGNAPDTVLSGVEQASTDDGFDVGYAAIGAGAALLLACLAMLGSSAIGRRRDSASPSGVAASPAA